MIQQDKQASIALARGSIITSAFLLFALEPLIAKRILPWFGGSSSVWMVCLVFYQLALLGGYGYATLLTRFLSSGKQAVIHTVLLAGSCLLLRIGPSAHWKPLSSSQPSWLILELLTATIGAPFALLSATSPLLQHWLANSGETKPYRFFAWSNFASLTALLAYPLLIEPRLDTTQQSTWWSAGFVLFAVLCAAFAWLKPTPLVNADSEPGPLRSKFFLWFALSACGSMLLLSITGQITENVAAVPLLWVLPLGIYLISFIVTFGSQNIYRRNLWLRLLAFSLAMLAYAAYDITAVLPIQISIPVYLAGLFFGCVFCQGELYRLRPVSAHLTTFYLVIAAGSAAGAIFVGLISPIIFGGIYELPLTLTLTGCLALALIWSAGNWAERLLWAAVTASMAAVFVMDWQAYVQNDLALKRSFYGSLRVVPSSDTRILYHGTVEHGAEYLAASRMMQPTTYYGPDSGVGILLREFSPAPKQVGIVGLGAGTLASYGQPMDTFRFYEINPQVIQLAQQYFAFLKDSRANVQIVEGDARLSLENEPKRRYDILVLDAFSGDAIPVHLLTREAMAIYSAHLRSGGVMAFHVSNNYLDLAPIVGQLASDSGYQCITVTNKSDKDNMVLASEWVLVTNNTTVLDNDGLKLHAIQIPKRSDLRPWTDSFNSLLPVLKTPEVR